MTTQSVRLAGYLARLIWLCMAPLLLLAVLLAWDSLRQQETKHLREGANLARNFATAIDQYLGARTSALHMLAVSPLVDDPLRWPELYAEAQGFQQSFGIHVIFANHDRQMLFNTRLPYGAKLPRLPDSKGRTAAPLALETGRPQVGDIVISPIDGKPLVAIAVPVQRENQPTRIMLSIFETERFRQRIGALALPPGWSVALKDSTGADIARRSPPGFDSLHDVADDHRFVVKTELAPWSMVLEIPSSIHWANQARSLLFLLAAIVLASLLGWLGGTLAGRRLGRQMNALIAIKGKEVPLPSIAEIAEARGLIDASLAALGASEARFRRLFNNAPVALGLASSDGAILAQNERFEQLFGYTLADMPSIDLWWQFAYPDPAYRAEAMTRWEAAMSAAGDSGGCFDAGEFHIACKGGAQRSVRISGIVMPEGVLAGFDDVTELRRAEEARQEYLAAALDQQKLARLAALNQMEDANAARRGAEASAERLRQLAEVVERIAAVRDLPSLMNVVRPAVRRLTGADGATLVLKDDGHCFYADEDAIGPLWKGQRFPLENCISGWAMLNARPAVIEDIYADPRIPHAAYRPTFVKSLVMMPVGRAAPAAAIGAYWATQHRASDEELELHQALADAMSIGLTNIDLIQNLERRVAERTAELSAANQELDSFAYAVSHDLRAPLRAMSGFSQALVEDFGDQLQGDAKVYLDQIDLASRRMGELIEGILVLSRSTRGEMQRDRVDLSAMARRLLDELARGEPERQVAVTVEDNLAAWGDARMLEAILANLLGNAWKYTGKADVAEIRVFAEVREQERRFCVADNGAGFDMAHVQRLFKPFQRLHRQDEFPGIGIGLATVYRIIQRHGGRIEARGEVGRGATFCFTLPGANPDDVSTGDSQ